VIKSIQKSKDRHWGGTGSCGGITEVIPGIEKIFLLKLKEKRKRPGGKKKKKKRRKRGSEELNQISFGRRGGTVCPCTISTVKEGGESTVLKKDAEILNGTERGPWVGEEERGEMRNEG